MYRLIHPPHDNENKTVSCDYGDEVPWSIKDAEFYVYVKNSQLLNQASATQSYLIS